MPHDLNLRKAIRGGSRLDLNPPGPGVGVDRAPSAGLDLAGAAAPVAISREPAPEIPAQALPEAPALPPSQAQPSRSLIPTFDDDPVGFVSLALRDVGAALQGLPSPVRELQKLEAQRRDSELKSLDISLRVLSAGRKQLEGVPADQREAAAREFGAQFDLPVDIGKLLLRTSEIPNLDSVLEQFGDETNQRIVQDMTNGDLEAIIGLTKDGDFMARMEAATDERLLPMVTAKLGAITEIIQNQASQSAGLERALASFETDEDGRTIIGLADLERLITNLPANLALTPAEFGVLKRNGDTLLAAGINTPELTAKIAETEATRTPLERIAAEKKAAAEGTAAGKPPTTPTSALLDVGGVLKPAFSSEIRRQSVLVHGGFIDPQTGEIGGLTRDAARNAVDVSAEAERLIKTGGATSIAEATAMAAEKVGVPVSETPEIQIPKETRENLLSQNVALTQTMSAAERFFATVSDEKVTGILSNLAAFTDATVGQVFDAFGAEDAVFFEDTLSAREALRLFSRDVNQALVLSDKFTVFEQKIIAKLVPSPDTFFQNPQKAMLDIKQIIEITKAKFAANSTLLQGRIPKGFSEEDGASSALDVGGMTAKQARAFLEDSSLDDLRALSPDVRAALLAKVGK